MVVYENTKTFVWNDLRTTIEPEKKLQIAETEIYRLEMSNCEFGDRNVVKLRIGV